MQEQPPTEVISDAPTQMAPPRAWSEENGAIEWEEMPDPRRPIIKYAVASLLTGAAAAFMLTGGIHPNNAPPPAPTPPTSSTIAAPTPKPPPTQDDRYIQVLETTFGSPTRDRDAAIKEGHWVCDYLGDGHTRQDVIKALNDANTGIDEYTRDRTNEAGAHAAITVYCPQYQEPKTDDGFITALYATNAGPDNDTAAIKDAHLACQELNNGAPRSQIVNEALANISGYTKDNANAFASLAAHFYCPQQMDNTFMQRFKDAGWKITDQAAAINSAHQTCDLLERGDNPDQVIKDWSPNDRGAAWTKDDDMFFINDSIQVYCPQYAKS
jgi:hypothetical protein